MNAEPPHVEDRPRSDPPPRKVAFFSYANEDRKWVREVHKRLKPLAARTKWSFGSIER
jgi:hypothetical protein